MHISKLQRLFFAVSIASLYGCGGGGKESDDSAGLETTAGEEAPEQAAAEPGSTQKTAVARLDAVAGGKTTGTVRFVQNGDSVEVEVELAGLDPKSTRAFHIHEVGDCSAPDFKSAGDHYNPANKPHGLPPVDERHAGDMGNLDADDEGKVSVTREFKTFSLDGEASILGRAVIIHAEADKGTQPSGGAGARIACGVIREETDQ